MLTSILNTQAEMLKVLSQGNGTALHSIPFAGNPNIEVKVIYARASALTLAELSNEEYPKISVWDYSPVINTEWMQNFQTHTEGFHNYDVNGDPASAYSIQDPMNLIFKYDFTVFVKNPMHRYAVMDYMLKNYNSRGQFILNKTVLPDGEAVGEVVGYNIILNEVTRTDGIFEMNYEFNIKAMVAVVDPSEFDLITDFNIFVNAVGLDINS